MNAKPEVILYSVPPSFYSQVARLALAEKGVSWQTRIIAAGPPIFESYRPWYMKLNPGGTVPTLVHNGDVVPDSLLIADYVEKTFDGPSLVPAEAKERAEMRRWLDAFRRIPVRELSYGSDKMKKVGAYVNRMRVHRLRKLAKQYPNMADIYNAKALDIQGFADNSVDEGHIARVGGELLALLDELDTVLAERPWVAGESYSLADAVWTVTVARFMAMGDLAPLAGRPALARWFDTVKQRPSFETADIWDRFKPGKMIKTVGGKLWPQLTALLLGVTAVCAGIWWLLSSP